jgi:hypothetical protein
LARFNQFDRSFSNNIEVQNALAVYYADILKFHGEAYKFVRRNGQAHLRIYGAYISANIRLTFSMATPLCHFVGTIPTAV